MCVKTRAPHSLPLHGLDTNVCHQELEESSFLTQICVIWNWKSQVLATLFWPDGGSLLSLLHCDVHGRRVRGHVDLGHHVEDEHLLHPGGRHEDVEHVLDVVEGVDELLHDLGPVLPDGKI